MYTVTGTLKKNNFNPSQTLFEEHIYFKQFYQNFFLTFIDEKLLYRMVFIVCVLHKYITVQGREEVTC